MACANVWVVLGEFNYIFSPKLIQAGTTGASEGCEVISCSGIKLSHQDEEGQTVPLHLDLVLVVPSGRMALQTMLLRAQGVGRWWPSGGLLLRAAHSWTHAF